MDFARVLRDSGLTKIELAQMYGVSRQTVHTWSTGGLPRVGSLLARQAEAITKALVVAVERQLLPFEAMDKGVRRERVAMMAARLQGLRPAPIQQ
ncbi:MAG: hypothetical protein IPM06_21670 [Rhizobiales bacterium]|nr:hypothetical protein [Hyphomicrobiales bacterium]